MPAPNRFNMLNFKMHISCVLLCWILAYSVDVDMQCSAACCCSCCCCCRSPFLTQIIIISLDSSSFLSCSLLVLTVLLLAIGTGNFVRPLAQCQQCTWSDSTNLPSHWYTLCVRMFAATRRNYILLSALKCLNFSFPSFSHSFSNCKF